MNTSFTKSYLDRIRNSESVDENFSYIPIKDLDDDKFYIFNYKKSPLRISGPFNSREEAEDKIETKENPDDYSSDSGSEIKRNSEDYDTKFGSKRRQSENFSLDPKKYEDLTFSELLSKFEKIVKDEALLHPDHKSDEYKELRQELLHRSYTPKK